MFAIILAGGRGSRLGPLTNDKPKPLVSLLDGYPILEHQLRQIEQAGIKDVVIAGSYKAEKIEQYLKRRENGNRKVNLLKLPFEIGSAGAVKTCLAQVSEAESYGILMYGDIVSDVNLRELTAQHQQYLDRGFTPLVTPVGLPGRYGTFVADGPFSAFFGKKPVDPGIYCLERAGALTFLPDKGEFSEDFLGKLIYGDMGAPYMHNGYWKDAGFLEDIEAVRESGSRWFIPREGEAIHLERT